MDLDRRVLIHIGTEKTGSTSIQEALRRAEIDGSLRPVRYPIIDGSRNHLQLANLYLARERMTRDSRISYPTEATLATFRRRYRRKLFNQLRTMRSAVLSSEILARLSVLEAGLLRRDLLAAGFREFRVVLYLRDPADYYLSFTQEVLKSSAAVPDPLRFRYPLRSIAQTWEQIFPGQLRVRGFSDAPDFDVVSDFADLTEEFLGVMPERLPVRLNPTVSAEGMEILHRHQSREGNRDAVTADAARLVRALQRSNARLSQTRPMLKPEIAASIRANHRDDAVYIYDNYGVDLRGDDAAPDVSCRVGDAVTRMGDLLQSVDDDVMGELLLDIKAPGREWSGWSTGRLLQRLIRAYQKWANH